MITVFRKYKYLDSLKAEATDTAPVSTTTLFFVGDTAAGSPRKVFLLADTAAGPLMKILLLGDTAAVASV